MGGSPATTSLKSGIETTGLEDITGEATLSSGSSCISSPYLAVLMVNKRINVVTLTLKILMQRGQINQLLRNKGRARREAYGL